MRRVGGAHPRAGASALAAPLLAAPLLGVASCLHTPPQPPFPGEVTREVERVDVLTRDGAPCLWESEQLRIAGADVWTRPPPVEEGWCVDGAEQAWMVEILGRDGPFLSTLLVEADLLVPRREARCVTWDLRSRQPTTLAAYDERHAERRLELLDRAVAKDPSLAGLAFDPAAFVVGGGHVRFCTFRGEQLVLVPVR